MSVAPTKMPSADSINADYQRVNGLIGEAYSTYNLHRKRLQTLVKERDAVLAQWRLFTQMAEAAKQAAEVKAEAKAEATDG